MSPDTDIAIVGGGMVGGTLAWALASAGYRVTLIEAQPFSSAAVPAILDERSVALSWSSRVLLEQMGLWSSLSEQVCPIRHIHVSERGRLGVTRLNAETEGVEALGYVVRNSAFLKQLYARLERTSGLTVKTGITLSGIYQNSSTVELEYKVDGKTDKLTAKLLIASDGSRSTVKEMLSIEDTAASYEQSAVIANVRCEKDHGNTAYERFTDSGPLAMLPLEKQIMAMVYTVNSEDAESTVALDDATMLSRLQRRFGYRLGRFENIGKRFVFPLTLLQSEEQYQGRVLMMGNAARTLHPVSGQGFNLGLRDIALWLELLTVAGCVDDPGEQKLLEEFCRQRQADQRSVVRFTDTLVRVFRGRAPLFSHIRASGLTALELLPPVKHMLARQSMGIATRLPDLSGLAVPVMSDQASSKRSL